MIGSTARSSDRRTLTHVLVKLTLSPAARCAAVLLAGALAACGPKPGAAPSPAAITADGCKPLVQQAAKNPDLLVDALPEPLRMDPSPIRRPVPPGVMRKDGSASVELTVLVDTAGRADMRTFKASASHPWFAEGAKQAVAKWRFQPATLGGCKVPRNYHWRADAPGRGGRGKRRG